MTRSVPRIFASTGLPVVLLFALAFGPAGCRKTDAPEPTAAPGIRKEFERGPVKVVVSTDRSELTIAERLNLTVEIFCTEDYEARLPRFGEKLEQFGIVDYSTAQPELVGDNQVRTARTYVLEPFLSGEYTIPPMTITFGPKGNPSAEPHELETEPIVIQVKSLLPEDLAEVAIHDITEPVELPRSYVFLYWGGGVALVLLVAAVLTVLLLRRRRGRRVAAQAERISPYERALRELERLVADDLPGRGEIKAFYGRISMILRTYIEGRFGLRAPEQTTQEFLATIGGSVDFPDAYRPLLDAFLTHCDLVKFAEVQPTTEEIQKTFDSCKSFVLGTKDEAPETHESTIRKLEY